MVKCCDYNSGMLRHEISIERRTNTADGSGGYTTTWSENIATYAHIKHKSGMERNKDGRIQAVKTTQITVRYIDDIVPTDRVKFKGRLFQIRAIIDVEERNDWMILECEEGPAT